VKRNRSTLKEYFKKGAIPTDANFADLIDSMINQEEDSLNKLPNDPLRITATGTDEALLNFYRFEQQQELLTWQVKQKPGGKPGLSIGDAAGSRFFVESGTGKVGVGTTTPKGELHVLGNLALGLDENNKKFIFHPRTNGNGDFLQITHDSADGNWDWTQGITLKRGGNVGIGTVTPGVKLEVNGNATIGGSLSVTKGSLTVGSIQIGSFTAADADEWPNFIWYRDTAAKWDEGLIKHSSSRGKFGRAGFGIHFDQSREFGFFSTNWNPLLAVEGGSGNTYIRGNLQAGNSDIYFTKTDHSHTGTGNAEGYAAIENDGGTYNALMILGRTQFSNGRFSKRIVKLWDYLEVNGNLRVTGYLQGNQVYFSAYLDSNSRSGAQNPLPMQVASQNVGNCYDINTSKFTAPVNGLYLFTMTGHRVDGSDWLFWYLMVNKDYANSGGTSVAESSERCLLSWSQNNVCSSRTIILSLKAGDTVWVQQTGSGRCDNFRSGLEGMLLSADLG
jgi:hypothetical protein